MTRASQPPSRKLPRYGGSRGPNRRLRRTSSLAEAVDVQEQLGEAKWLAEDDRTVDLRQRAAPRLGHQDHRQRRALLDGHPSGEQLEAVHHRHVLVAEDD